MLGIFILGLLAAISITVLVIGILNLKWFYTFTKERLKESESKKIMIVDMRNVYEEVKNNKALLSENKKHSLKYEPEKTVEKETFVEKEMADLPSKKELSLEDLGKMCSETPYIVADYNTVTEDIDNYEALKPESTDMDFVKCMNENDGMIVVGE